MSKETLAREKFLSGNSSVERNSLARSKYLAADSPPDRFAAVSPPSAPTPPGLFSPVLLFLDIHTHPDRSLSTFPCSLAQLPTYSSIPAVTLSLDPCANEPMVNLVDTVISKGCPVVSSFPLVYIPATGVFVAIAISRSNTVTEKRPPAAAPSPSPTLCPRLFISGVLSHCGKTSICLSLLSHLLTIYQPRELAYIKPATQCEATSIITTWCAEKGIDCVPVGPVVFYKGFTRSYIDGSLGETAECMGDSISAAIDELSLGKKFILIDGVGYPAVGSITGTCNAAVAKASGVALKSGGRLAAPVVIIGKPGVGDAVDSYNLMSTYFSYNDVTVLGCIFNKVPVEGYYSLENVKPVVTQWFDKFATPFGKGRAYGFVPVIPVLEGARDNSEKMDEALKEIDDFRQVFVENVDCEGLVRDCLEYFEKGGAGRESEPLTNGRTQRSAVEAVRIAPTEMKRSRQEIEKEAMQKGATGG